MPIRRDGNIDLSSSRRQINFKRRKVGLDATYKYQRNIEINLNRALGAPSSSAPRRRPSPCCRPVTRASPAVPAMGSGGFSRRGTIWRRSWRHSGLCWQQTAVARTASLDLGGALATRLPYWARVEDVRVGSFMVATTAGEPAIATCLRNRCWARLGMGVRRSCRSGIPPSLEARSCSPGKSWLPAGFHFRIPALLRT